MKNPFGVKTRKAGKSDWDFYYRVTRDTLWPYIAKYITPSKEILYENFLNNYLKGLIILMKGKRRIGFYALDYEKNCLYIRKIFLSPFYQRKGIGTFLMNYFETLGYKKIRLELWDNNKPALDFYKKSGYKVIKKKNHKIVMEKLL